jgi:predicted nucleic acid-binding protein
LIVADTNLIAYFLIPGAFTPEAEGVYQRDSDWIAPALWRSELMNALTLYIRRAQLTLDASVTIMERAERLMKDSGYKINPLRILRLAEQSGCAAYDCEFVALAQELGLTMVTSDRTIIEKFKPTVVSMKSFCSS